MIPPEARPPGVDPGIRWRASRRVRESLQLVSSAGESARFLVVQTRDIGDVLLSTALCGALGERCPGARVDMLTMSHCAGVVTGHPSVHELLVLDKQRRNEIRYMARLLGDIRSRRYDVIFNVQGQLIGLLTCLASRRSARVGFDKAPWSLLHSANVKLKSQAHHSGRGHTLDDRFALFAPLGLDTTPGEYRIWLTEGERLDGAACLRAAGLDLERPIVILGIHARDDYKRWPPGYFVEMARRLVERHGVQIYVPFGPGERPYSDELVALLPSELRASVFDGVVTRSIRELAGVFAHCALYLGNDTGPRHIAQALDVPALAVISPASCKWSWIPWGDPRFRAIDVGDALGLSRPEWDGVRAGLTWGGDDAEWFAKLTPDAVDAQLVEMTRDLGLFQTRAATAARESRSGPGSGR